MSFYRKLRPDPATPESRISQADMLDLAEDDYDDGRLPLHIAAPVILVLSLSCWALIVTMVLWLLRIEN